VAISQHFAAWLLQHLSVTCYMATLTEVIWARFQRRHLDRCADVEPRSDGKLVLELFA
jgi:hypothetical protein